MDPNAIQQKTQSACPKCHSLVRPTDYFCYNCGTNLKPKPLNTSIFMQLVLYVGSVVLVPFGIIWGWRYLRQPFTKSKIVGSITIIITIISTIIITIYSINLINDVQRQVNEGIEKQLRNVGY
ncbi:hypothetical protein A3A93_04975 [Candidatus Roizmanbacteria bacterium RIFCSPLOWO2_01_FULL_38_12]|uniref:Zinc-ribbon domain-containing protein n=1 Tax=Candidatus Roizmanbacteria bacterium RIFCSPLOWO2_01_FULL_38_12 TaxID=1802061 RepID=A0A1F7J0N7_9BACT|nr:MAG: hypothetical protein A2861_03425 [Candidatus Roizmanbacteria bacterium RIFCSPHIGHO2_01_FULL_38_15]OGK36205.1 MAG: hypothetical protein A3F59_04535 [Candidatus Roizmanbacteria bacterium RIFCSPHIGHO2_12_FULL_38_13]OGK49186.1 MAG: hypothetical protein A3A93_04975 [Candidatus Roizmanbacteria bacterium RIFCSPLOWO2_01_FULL_38_12]